LLHNNFKRFFSKRIVLLYTCIAIWLLLLKKMTKKVSEMTSQTWKQFILYTKLMDYFLINLLNIKKAAAPFAHIMYMQRKFMCKRYMHTNYFTILESNFILYFARSLNGCKLYPSVSCVVAFRHFFSSVYIKFSF
jgi:hypothetical protein